jgi:hypothetical protein
MSSLHLLAFSFDFHMIEVVRSFVSGLIMHAMSGEIVTG